MNCFGIVRQEDFDGKPWYSLPDTLWSMKFCNTVNFQKQRMVSLQNVSVQWNQKFSTESRATHPIFFLIVSDARKFLKDINVCLWNVLGPWNTTISTKTRAIPSYAQLFSVTEISETLKSSPTKSSSTMRDKKKSMEECPTPSPIHKKNFRCRIFPETQKGSATKCFGTVSHYTIEGQMRYRPPPPPLCKSFFDARSFLESRSVSLRNVLVLWDKEVSTEICQRRPPPYPWNSLTPEILWNSEVFN